MEHFAKTAELKAIFVQIWIDLAHGALRGSHPFHTPVLASQGAHGPDARTVILREANQAKRRLLCHTDFRSAKVEDLRANPSVSWLFYDRENNTQLRIKGRATVSHQDELARARWALSAERSKACYHATLAPGTTAQAPLAPAPLESGFENFAVIDCRVNSLDWLLLQHEGHLRARFDWSGGGWENCWLAP